MSAEPPAPRGRLRRNRKRLLGGAASVVVVGAVFVFVLPRIADYRDVWEVVKGLSWQDGLVLAGATVLNLATFPPPWMVALPGLGYREGMAMTQASTALSLVSPAGAAVGMAASYSMLRSWRFEGRPVALAVAVTGVWNQFANLAFPILALALLTAENQKHPRSRRRRSWAWWCSSRRVARLRARAVERLASALDRRPRRARRASRARLVRREVAWTGEGLVGFRSGALGLLRRRWHVLTLATLAGHLTVFLLLLACLRAVGVGGSEVSLVEAFAAWALVRILGALPLTPGGIGIVELGLSGALVAFGAPNAGAVAATLLYRALTVLPTLALGLLAAATWRSHHPREVLGSPE